jgi:hypothetical protein
MATSQRCCHLPDEMLNSAAECADRARIDIERAKYLIFVYVVVPLMNYMSSKFKGAQDIFVIFFLSLYMDKKLQML